MSMEIMIEQNPWWENVESINDDPFVSDYDDSLVKWKPKLLGDIDTKRNVVYSVRGPRQVGKTTLLKLIIRELLLSGINPRDILYLSCESLGSWTELRDALRLYLSTIRRNRAYLFLDEVTSIEEWARPIKYLYDVGILRGNFVLLSGSHALDLLVGTERLVGRRGEYEKVPDLVLLPMTFGEYIEATDPALYNKLLDGNTIENLIVHHRRVMTHYENYLRGGGFPHAQDSLLKTGTIRFYIVREFINYVRQDIAKSGLSTELVMKILRKMLMVYPGITSWRSIASEIGFSHVAISAHAEKIRALFLVEYLYPPKIEEKTLVPDIKKDKKIVFLDPFMVYALNYWFYGTTSIERTWRRWIYDPQKRGRMLESLILRHLIYWTYKNIYKEEILDKIFYFRKNSIEVDFIAIKDRIALIIESKKRKKITRSLAIGETIVKPRKPLKILATEGDLEEKPNYIVMPIPYLLFLLSTDRIDETLNR